MSDYLIRRGEGPRKSVNRAMVSLGPLSAKRYCTYRCAFCYVDGPFQRYPRRKPAEIVEWLAARRDEFDIVYVSGDTDSFSPPRTDEAIELMERLVELDVDALLTTRHAFSEPEIERLSAVAVAQGHRGKLLVACASVLRLAQLAEEPKPIPPAEARLRSLERLADAGAQAVLTVRPLLPQITGPEVEGLIDACPGNVTHVVTGWLYDNKPSHVAPASEDADPQLVPMYFDIRRHTARLVRNQAAYRALEGACHASGRTLHLGSTSLIEELRATIGDRQVANAVR